MAMIMNYCSKDQNIMKLYDQSYSTSCSALHYSTVHSAKTCNHTILVLWRLWDMNMNRNRIFNKISRILQTLFKDTFSNSVIFIVKWTEILLKTEKLLKSTIVNFLKEYWIFYASERKSIDTEHISQWWWRRVVLMFHAVNGCPHAEWSMQQQMVL